MWCLEKKLWIKAYNEEDIYERAGIVLGHTMLFLAHLEMMEKHDEERVLHIPDTGERVQHSIQDIERLMPTLSWPGI